MEERARPLCLGGAVVGASSFLGQRGNPELRIAVETHADDEAG